MFDTAATSNRRILSSRDLDNRGIYSRVQRWRLIRKGDFPQPLILGKNRIGWFENEINEWLESRPRRTYAAPEQTDAT